MPTDNLQAQVDRFNDLYPVGTEVDLRMDSGELRRTKVKHQAFVLSGHTPVAFFEGVRGCYWIECVRPIPSPNAEAVPFRKTFGLTQRSDHADPRQLPADDAA